jgi:hypothetical protein
MTVLLLLPTGAKSFPAWNKTVAHVTAERLSISVCFSTCYFGVPGNGRLEQCICISFCSGENEIENSSV